jgi:hypothetical protein
MDRLRKTEGWASTMASTTSLEAPATKLAAEVAVACALPGTGRRMLGVASGGCGEAMSRLQRFTASTKSGLLESEQRLARLSVAGRAMGTTASVGTRALVAVQVKD